MLQPAVVGRVEQGELLVGDFAAAHPERPRDGDAASRLFVGAAVGLAHDEFTGGNADQIQREAVAQRNRLRCGAAIRCLTTVSLLVAKWPTFQFKIEDFRLPICGRNYWDNWSLA